MSLLDAVKATKLAEDNQSFDTNKRIGFIVELPINEIKAYRDEFGNSQPFKIEQSELQSLMLSINKNGLEEPIKVKQLGLHEYMVLSGHRRLEACKILGYKTISAQIVDVDADKEFEYVCNGNVYRKTEYMSTFGQILMGYKKRGKSVQEIADIFGLDRRSYYRYMHVANCIPDLQHLGDKGFIRLEAFEVLDGLSESDQNAIVDFYRTLNKKFVINKSKAKLLLTVSQSETLSATLLNSLFFDDDRKDTSNDDSNPEAIIDDGFAGEIIKGYILLAFDQLNLAEEYKINLQWITGLLETNSADQARQRAENERNKFKGSKKL